MTLSLFLTLLFMTLVIASSLYIRRMKQTMSETRDDAALFFHHSPAALIVVNSSNRILKWNEAAQGHVRIH